MSIPELVGKYRPEYPKRPLVPATHCTKMYFKLDGTSALYLCDKHYRGTEWIQEYKAKPTRYRKILSDDVIEPGEKLCWLCNT